MNEDDANQRGRNEDGMGMGMVMHGNGDMMRKATGMEMVIKLRILVKYEKVGYLTTVKWCHIHTSL